MLKINLWVGEFSTHPVDFFFFQFSYPSALRVYSWLIRGTTWDAGDGPWIGSVQMPRVNYAVAPSLTMGIS